MNTERLERIKRQTNYGSKRGGVHPIPITYEDVYFLIEQSEKRTVYEELSADYMAEIMKISERKNDIYERMKRYQEVLESLYEENERLREALVFATEELTTILEVENLAIEQIAECAGSAYNKINEALEQSK